MHRTNSELRTLIPHTDSISGTVIPDTDSGSRAVIQTQKGPSADSDNNSEPGATNEPRAIYGSRAMMPGTDSEPRAMSSNGNAERIDPERDLQIASSSNGQSIDPRNKHALLVLMSQCTEDADPEEPKTLDEDLSSPNRTQ
jgi:hypothetical protein